MNFQVFFIQLLGLFFGFNLLPVAFGTPTPSSAVLKPNLPNHIVEHFHRANHSKATYHDLENYFQALVKHPQATSFYHEFHNTSQIRKDDQPDFRYMGVVHGPSTGIRLPNDKSVNHNGLMYHLGGSKLGMYHHRIVNGNDEFWPVVKQIERVDHGTNSLDERSFTEAVGKVIDLVSSPWVAIPASIVLGSYFAPAIIARWRNLIQGWRVADKAAAVIQAGLNGDPIREETIDVALKVFKVKLDKRTNFPTGDHELCEIDGGQHDPSCTMQMVRQGDYEGPNTRSNAAGEAMQHCVDANLGAGSYDVVDNNRGGDICEAIEYTCEGDKLHGANGKRQC